MRNTVSQLFYRRVFFQQYPVRLRHFASQHLPKSYSFHRASDKLPAVNYFSRRYITVMSDLKDLFKGHPDRFNGVTVDSNREGCDSTTFTEKLERSLENWVTKEVRGVWFKVALKDADWVPVLAQRGFSFHHAKPEYVMMYKYLPTTEESNAPRFAHTMIGVGAVVVNDSDEILVVREKHAFMGFPHWKLPGGYVEAGEDLEDAAIREVMEETSIQTKFQCLVSFRLSHGGNFGCSDIYFVVGLKPISSDIKKCEREIVAAEWMKIDEYLNHDYVHETNRLFLQKYLEYRKTGTIIGAEKGIHPLVKKPYTVFEIVKGNLNEPDTGEKSKI